MVAAAVVVVVVVVVILFVRFYRRYSSLYSDILQNQSDLTIVLSTKLSWTDLGEGLRWPKPLPLEKYNSAYFCSYDTLSFLNLIF